MEHLTRVEIRDAVAGIDSELAELERTHVENVDMRPWVSDDHPVSLQHWGLVQKRLRLREQLKKAGLTPERRAALVAAGQGTRLNRTGKALVPACKSTIDPRSDPQHPSQRLASNRPNNHWELLTNCVFLKTIANWQKG
jgi:hypothetical protein